MGRRRNPISSPAKTKTQSGYDIVIFTVIFTVIFAAKTNPRLLPTEAQPDEVDRGSHAEQAAGEQEPMVVRVDPMIEAIANSTPNKQA